VHAVAIALTRRDAGDEAVPDAERALGQLDPPLAAVLTDQAQLDRVGDRGRDREPDAAGLRVRAERERVSWQHVIGGHCSILPGQWSDDQSR
jgi:hypothetical protein